MTDGADLLREAAQTLREKAKAARRWDGGWEVDPDHPARVIEDKHGNGWDNALIAKCVDYGDTENGTQEAAFIALMDPTVALAVADWLDATAATREDPYYRENYDDLMRPALAVARAVLRRES